MKLYSRNALAHQLSEKPWFKLFHSNVETGNDPLSEELIAPIVLYLRISTVPQGSERSE